MRLAENKKFVLIKSNDFYSPDNIEGRLQTEIYDTYEKAYNAMRSEVVSRLKLDDKRWRDYMDNVLEHINYTNVYLGPWSARIHTDFGECNSYWKIVEV